MEVLCVIAFPFGVKKDREEKKRKKERKKIFFKMKLPSFAQKLWPRTRLSSRCEKGGVKVEETCEKETGIYQELWSVKDIS